MLSKDQQRALLYVAARFMMVRIDLCAKRKRSSLLTYSLDYGIK